MKHASVLRIVGAIGLLGVLVSTFLLAAGAAGAPSLYVPGRSGGWPGWLTGPLGGLGFGLGEGRFQTLTLVMCGSYLLALLGARALPGRVIAATIVLAHVILFLGPPLMSQDVFGYIGFARLGILHGLDPYSYTAAAAPRDAIDPFLGWFNVHSPYGPLFTLGSYALVPLGIGGGLWALKAIACLASLGTIALVARAARGMGRSPRAAAVFLGCNPVLLSLAVSGAHNDMLILLLLAATLALSTTANPRYTRATGTLIAAIGVKASAGLVLPFLVLGPRRLRERIRTALSAGGWLLALIAIGLLGFGTHILGFLGAVQEQQQLIATHSIPAETARWFGLQGVPGWWRNLYAGLFLLVLAFALWRTARGADWRAAAGWTTLALLISTAWLLPWYAIWVLPLAAVSGDRRLRVASLVFCAYAIAIHLPLAEPLLSPPLRKLPPHVLPLGSHPLQPRLLHHEGANELLRALRR